MKDIVKDYSDPFKLKDNTITVPKIVVYIIDEHIWCLWS